MHLNIYIPDGTQAILPLSLYVDKDTNDNNKIKIYIKYSPNYSKFYINEVNNYLQTKSEEKIPIKLINGLDPFEYIQNWGWNYYGLRSPHGQFSKNIQLLNEFYLILYPLLPEELNVKFEFESSNDKKDFIILDYFVIFPDIQTLNELNGFNQKLLQNIKEEEFKQFFTEEMKKYVNNINIPNIFKMYDNFLEKKGTFRENVKNGGLQWNFEINSLDNNIGIKCRCDEKNKVNVFLQQSFMLDIQKANEVIENCTDLFYSNDYPIIGIENQNGGGIIPLAKKFHQSLNLITLDRMCFSGRSTNLYNQQIKDSLFVLTNSETCKPLHNIDDFMDGIQDDYSTETKTILH